MGSLTWGLFPVLCGQAVLLPIFPPVLEKVSSDCRMSRDPRPGHKSDSRTSRAMDASVRRLADAGQWHEYGERERGGGVVHQGERGGGMDGAMEKEGAGGTACRDGDRLRQNGPLA